VVSLRIRRPVTGSVLVVVTGSVLMPMTGRVLVVVAVEMVEIAAGVPAATANEVDPNGSWSRTCSPMRSPNSAGTAGDRPEEQGHGPDDLLDSGPSALLLQP